ncbi:MAG: hypothetical protein IKI63_01060 [Clostridia bacterium]|nr:hypothetical protein [Clostridia bacterium]
MNRMIRGLAMLSMLCLCVGMLSGCSAWTFFRELLSGTEASSAESGESSSDPSEMIPPAAEPLVTVTIGTASGEKGDTVLIPVDITADSRLVNADLYIRYDPGRLRAIKQYDADADESRWTTDGIWQGSIWAAEPSEGLLHIMLATGEDEGLTAGGTLFGLVFEVLDDLDQPALLQPQLAVCGVLGEDSREPDLAAVGLASAIDGLVTAPTATDRTAESE